MSTLAHHTRRLATRTIAVAALAMVAAGVAPSPAGAVATTARSGSPGTVANSTAGAQDRIVLDSGRTIGESPAYANQAQTVCITTTLWRIVYTAPGSVDPAFWRADQSHRRCGTITAAQSSIRDNGVWFSVQAQVGYSISADIRWYAANGTQIANRFEDYRHTADYVCVQGVYRCNINVTSWGSRDAYVSFW